MTWWGEAEWNAFIRLQADDTNCRHLWTYQTTHRPTIENKYAKTYNAFAMSKITHTHAPMNYPSTWSYINFDCVNFVSVAHVKIYNQTASYCTYTWFSFFFSQCHLISFLTISYCHEQYFQADRYLIICALRDSMTFVNWKLCTLHLLGLDDFRISVLKSAFIVDRSTHHS